MLNFKKLLLIPSVIALPLVATTLVSCSTIDRIDDNLASQLASLTSPEAKEIYSNYWSRDAFAELFLISKDKKADVNSEPFKANKKIINKYLLKLEDIKEPIIINSTLTISGADISKEIYERLFEAYDFYTSWKTSSDSNYFRNQKTIWAKDQLSLGNKTIQMDFTPQFAYSSNTYTSPEEVLEFKNDFELLYKIIQTKIQTELLNMIIAEFYFTSATSDMIQRGTNYNEIIDGEINSINYWNTTSFNLESETYFLEKYLVEKNPKIKWNFTSEQPDKVSDWRNKRIKSSLDYAKLWNGEQVGTTSSPKRIFSDKLLIKSGDSIMNKEAINLYGYNSSIELSATSGEGDLSTDADAIRMFGVQSANLSSGLFNNETKKFVSYDTLGKREKIEKLVNSGAGYIPTLPAISLLDSSETTRKNSKQITLNDLKVTLSNGDIPIVEGSIINGDSTWKIANITPILNSSSRQTIEINMTYTYKNFSTPEFNFEDYPYTVIVAWDQTTSPGSANIKSDLEEDMSFSSINQDNSFGKQQIFGVNPVVDGKLNITYYMRILPKFEWNEIDGTNKEVLEIDSKEKAVGKFNMAGTPWDSTPENKENQRKLAFTLYLNDPELLTEIKKYLVLNDISIRPGKISEVNDILKELEIIYLDKKPDYAKPRINFDIK